MFSFLPPFVFPNPDDETISWSRERGRLTRGLTVGVAEEEEEGGDDERVGRAATRKGGVYFWGILMRRGDNEVFWGSGGVDVVRVLVVWIVFCIVVLLPAPDMRKSPSLVAGCLVWTMLLPLGLESSGERVLLTGCLP